MTKPLNVGQLLNFLTFMVQKRTVVIVDDDLEFSRTIEDILRLHKFAVKPIANSDNILAELENSEEIVLLDMKLDNGNGLDVLRQIKQHYPHQPVILITGQQEESGLTRKTSLAAGAHSFIYKPVKIEELLNILTEIHHQQLGWRLGRITS